MVGWARNDPGFKLSSQATLTKYTQGCISESERLKTDVGNRGWRGKWRELRFRSLDPALLLNVIIK